eukprot:gene97-104_t
MLLSDIHSLRKVLRNTAVLSTETQRRNESVDMDIERMYFVGTPKVSEWPIAFNFDNLYSVEDEEVTHCEMTPLACWPNCPDETEPEFKCVVPPAVTTATEMSSALTKMLDEAKKPTVGRAKNNEIELTIYLPDSNSMEVYVKESCTFGELIRAVLLEHKLLGLKPPLHYDDASFYEIRLHEGDGEPDRDFSAFDNEKILKQYELDEYCICEVEGYSAMDRSYNQFQSLSLFQSMDMSSAKLHQFDFSRDFGSFSTPSPVKNSTSGVLPDSSSRRIDEEDGPLNGSSDHSEQQRYIFQELNSVENATIRFPNGQQVEVPFDKDTTLQQLLSLVPKLHPLTKLRLYTDEYVFTISQQDQRRLQYASPKMDLSVKVSSIGTTFFDLQKKTYADSVKMAKSKVTPQVTNTNQQSAITVRASEVESYNFNEATANAYQEWNVVKKNRFGRKQERIFGVDGKKVYNGKRGQLKGGVQAKQVQRAERDISSIVNIEILPSDSRTFRITWRDDKDLYDIEYSFETSRECAEAIAKIKYIRNRDLKALRNQMR